LSLKMLIFNIHIDSVFPFQVVQQAQRRGL
jgi:hypothetical protein